MTPEEAITLLCITGAIFGVWIIIYLLGDLCSKGY